jgi:hypothetical protein
VVVKQALDMYPIERKVKFDLIRNLNYILKEDTIAVW